MTKKVQKKISNQGNNDNNVGDDFLEGKITLKSSYIILVTKSHSWSYIYEEPGKEKDAQSFPGVQ